MVCCIIILDNIRQFITFFINVIEIIDSFYFCLSFIASGLCVSSNLVLFVLGFVRQKFSIRNINKVNIYGAID